MLNCPPSRKEPPLQIRELRQELEKLENHDVARIILRDQRPTPIQCVYVCEGQNRFARPGEDGGLSISNILDDLRYYDSAELHVYKVSY